MYLYDNGVEFVSGQNVITFLVQTVIMLKIMEGVLSDSALQESVRCPTWECL